MLFTKKSFFIAGLKPRSGDITGTFGVAENDGGGFETEELGVDDI